MKRAGSLLLIVIAAWTLAAGLPPAPQVSNEELIRGFWSIVGYLDQEKRRGRWEIEWTFEDGKFKQTGYPTLKQTGKYRVLSSEAEKLTLELYEQNGTFGSKNRRIEIVVDQQKDQLRIGGVEPFLRVKPKP